MVLRIVFFFFFFWLQGIDATVDGVLGGYGHVNEVDIKGSEGFLKLLFSERLGGQSPNLVALGKLIFNSFFFFWRGEIKLLFLNLKFVIFVVCSLSVNGICFTTAYGIVNVQF